MISTSQPRCATNDAQNERVLNAIALQHAPNTSAATSSSGGEESSGGGGTGSSSGGEESTTGGPGDGSSSGGESEGSSSGGGVSEECVTFCSRYFNTCGGNAGNDYASEEDCQAQCSGWDAAGFECRQMHLELAQEDADTHCPHASGSGGGVC